MLRIEGITVEISAVTVLRGLSLAVETGATVGLVGRNGAGKTTTLRSVMGLTHLSSGRIDLDGMVTARYGLDEAENALRQDGDPSAMKVIVQPGR